MKRRHLKMSKGRGSIPADILMERIKRVIAEDKLKAKTISPNSKKTTSRKIA